MSSVFVPSQNGPNKMINASHDLPMCLSVLAYSIRNIIPGSAILNYTRWHKHTEMLAVSKVRGPKQSETVL